tara:strand:- start:245 stop:565 length:321 start_codon:yes stop_codon:yes gene_type:complete
MKKMKELLSEIRFRDEHNNILRLSDITKEYQDKFLTSPGAKHGEPIEEQAPLPADVKRFMGKFTDSLKGAGLNRMKQAQVLAGVVDALDIEPKELMQLIQRVKRGM